jgi:AraC family transcriptional regulator of adaptative response / DNA-3-methyladenine glycosylase II
MTTGLNQAARYRAILGRDKKYDGTFYFALKASATYCRPSCTAIRPSQKNYLIFNSAQQAQSQGYRPCYRCHPDNLESELSSKILDSIKTGVINEKGVGGLASSLHISERHLRRIVRSKTGESPLHLNQTKRLRVARRLIIQTELPIIDVAFNAGFSSLRQFNDVFRRAFKTSPREMRKAAILIAKKQIFGSIIFPLRSARAEPFRAKPHN